MTSMSPLRYAPIKRVAQVTTGEMPARVDGGEVPVIGANGPIGVTDRSNLDQPAIVVGRVGSAGAVNFVEPPAWISDNALVVVPLPQVMDYRFACHLLSTVDFARDAVQTAQPLITQTLVREWLIPLPALRAQRAIADYLDTETARIDRLIALRTEQARLMQTRLDGLVRQSVSADGDGNPYPRIPLRRRWEVVDCKHRTPEYVDDGIPVVSPGDAKPGRLDLAVCTRFVTREDFEDLAEGDRRPRRGDIVYSRNASIGIASYVGGDDEFTMGQDVCVIRSLTQDQRFLTYVLNTLGVDQLEEQKLGSTFSRINVSQILGLSIPCPPAERQSAIADALDSASERSSRIVDTIAVATGLLQERRQALITAAVTGQIEIPGVAA